MLSEHTGNVRSRETGVLESHLEEPKDARDDASVCPAQLIRLHGIQRLHWHKSNLMTKAVCVKI